MGRARRRAFLPLLAAVVAAGCQPSADAAPEIRLAWSVRPERPVIGPVVVSLTLTDDTSGEPVEGAQVRLEGTMSHPGMTPVLATARETEPGRYEVSMDLTMAGEWILLVEVELADGRTLRRQVELPRVRIGRCPPGPVPGPAHVAPTARA